MAFKIQIPKKTSTQANPQEWKTWRLEKWFTIMLLFIEVAIIIVIIVLQRDSTKNQGIAQLSQSETEVGNPLSITNTFWSYGLLWTAMPSFLMAIYYIGWAAIVSGTAERQPFIDLNVSENNASTVYRTIMLDYRCYPVFYNWLIAFRRKHILIGCAMTLSSLLSIILVPLASHLLVAASAEIVSDFTAVFPNTYDSAPLLDLDLQPALGLARSTLVYGAEPPAWATPEFSFEPFDTAGSVIGQNFTVPVTAYYGQVDCEIMDLPKPTVTSSNALGVALTNLSYNITDRGCDLSGIQFNLGRKIVAETYTPRCSEASRWSRIVLMTGNPTSASTIENNTVISCIPSYWKTSGLVSVSIEKDLFPRVDVFTEDGRNETEFRPQGADTMESDVTLYESQDPKGVFLTDVLGTVIYEVAGKSNPGNPLDSAALKKAIESVWPATIAYITTTYLLQKPDTHTVQGQTRQSETRLFVVSPVAWTIVIFMILILLCNGLLILHAETHHSILEEEPIGLLGAAVLLQDSDLADLVEKVRGTGPPYNTKVRETIKEDYTRADSSCWYDLVERRIRLTGLGPVQTASQPSAAPAQTATQPSVPPAQTVTQSSVPPIQTIAQPLVSSATAGQGSASLARQGSVSSAGHGSTTSTRPGSQSSLRQGTVSSAAQGLVAAPVAPVSSAPMTQTPSSTTGSSAIQQNVSPN